MWADGSLGPEFMPPDIQTLGSLYARRIEGITFSSSLLSSQGGHPHPRLSLEFPLNFASFPCFMTGSGSDPSHTNRVCSLSVRTHTHTLYRGLEL